MKGPSEEELDIIIAARRSIVASKKIEPGHIICKSDLSIKRPGTGIEPKYLDLIIGMTIINRKDKDSIILWDDLA